MSKPVSERALIGLIGAIQFVNILDFMMVMPLGPDFAGALGIPLSQLGLVGGSYTAAAAVSGIAGAFFLDRFDRKSALLVAMVGLVIGTAAGAFATDLPSLIAARVVAGAFGGPATSIALSIISDVIPQERRGRAMGAVMGAFSAASILGVPFGLELARIGGWRAPFIGVAALGVLVVVFALAVMPSMRGHIDAGAKRHTVGELAALFRRPVVVYSYLAMGLAMMSAFALIPAISPHLQQNLRYPREDLGVLYLVGGAFSFFSMRITGVIVDRIGAFRVNTVGVLGFLLVVWLAFVLPVPPIPLVILFAAFMVAQSTRNVSLTTLVSQVPAPHERAGYMSVRSAVEHLASATGAVLSARMLHDGPDGTILGMHDLALFAMVVSLVTPPFVWAVERRVRSTAPPPPALTSPRGPRAQP